jgi:hypothetical protein
MKGMGRKMGKNRKGGMPFDRLRAGYKANDFRMMPPRRGLEIILKAVFLQRFRAAGAGIGI